MVLGVVFAIWCTWVGAGLWVDGSRTGPVHAQFDGGPGSRWERPGGAFPRDDAIMDTSKGCVGRLGGHGGSAGMEAFLRAMGLGRAWRG